MKEENADFIVTNNIETCLKELNKAFKCLNSLKKIDSILENETIRCLSFQAALV